MQIAYLYQLIIKVARRTFNILMNCVTVIAIHIFGVTLSEFVWDIGLQYANTMCAARI